jgi:hypothetical protein
LYDFVLFVQSAKQEIQQQAVKQRKFWRFNVVVVYCNLLFLLLFGTFWYTLGGLAHLTKNSPENPKRRPVEEKEFLNLR